MAPGATTPSSRASGTPWGELTWSGTALATGFQSQFTDPLTGWVGTPARWYVPSLSRFASPDPLPGDPELPLSLNRYAYALDDPVSRSDPSGLSALVHQDTGGKPCGRACEGEGEAGDLGDSGEVPERPAGDGSGDLDGSLDLLGNPEAPTRWWEGRDRVLLVPDCLSDAPELFPSGDRRSLSILTVPAGCAAVTGTAQEQAITPAAPTCAVGFVGDGLVCAGGPDAAGRRRWPGWGEELGPDDRPRPVPLGGPRNPNTGAPWFLPGRCGKLCKGVTWGLLVGYTAYRTCQIVGAEGCR